MESIDRSPCPFGEIALKYYSCLTCVFAAIHTPARRVVWGLGSPSPSLAFVCYKLCICATHRETLTETLAIYVPIFFKGKRARNKTGQIRQGLINTPFRIALAEQWQKGVTWGNTCGIRKLASNPSKLVKQLGIVQSRCTAVQETQKKKKKEKEKTKERDRHYVLRVLCAEHALKGQDTYLMFSSSRVQHLSAK